jgi:hypothetical protein
MDTNTEIEVVKTQVNRALSTVQTLVVTTKEEYEQAVEIGGKLKKVFKMVTDRKEEITKPLNEALKSARALFKPLEESLEDAENELKNKMLVYKTEERKQEEEARRIADAEIARLEAQKKAGEIDNNHLSLQKMELNAEAEKAKVEKTVKTETGAKATEKFITEYVVVDVTKIPLHFMEPDMVRIKASFKAGTPVEGVEERKKAIISF